jgi:hypothetical protein
MAASYWEDKSLILKFGISRSWFTLDHELSAFQKEPAKFSKTSFVVSILLSTNHGHGSDVRTGVIVGGLSNKKCTQVVVAGSVVDNNPCFWDATFQR